MFLNLRIIPMNINWRLKLHLAIECANEVSLLKRKGTYVNNWKEQILIKIRTVKEYLGLAKFPGREMGHVRCDKKTRLNSKLFCV